MVDSSIYFPWSLSRICPWGNSVLMAMWRKKRSKQRKDWRKNIQGRKEKWLVQKAYSKFLNEKSLEYPMNRYKPYVMYIQWASRRMVLGEWTNITADVKRCQETKRFLDRRVTTFIILKFHFCCHEKDGWMGKICMKGEAWRSVGSSFT